MNFKTIGLSSALVVSSILLGNGAEWKITLDKAPEAVQKAIQKQAGSNKIVRLEKAEDEGQIRYEALTERKTARELNLSSKPTALLIPPRSRSA